MDCSAYVFLQTDPIGRFTAHNKMDSVFRRMYANAYLSPKSVNDSVDNRLKVLVVQGRWE